jgi:type II secretion system protein H
MTSARPARRSARGFTFIEMLVVIAILALVASIVVVNMDGMSAPTKLRGSARAMGNLLLSLKEMAALKNRALSVEFDVEGQRWRVIDAPNETDVPNAKEREEATYYGDWDSPPSGVRLAELSFSSTDVARGSSTIITFQGDGEVAPSGFVAFFTYERMKDEDGISVEVSGLTGLVTYRDGHFKAEEIRKAEDF